MNQYPIRQQDIINETSKNLEEAEILANESVNSPYPDPTFSGIVMNHGIEILIVGNK